MKPEKRSFKTLLYLATIESLSLIALGANAGNAAESKIVESPQIQPDAASSNLDSIPSNGDASQVTSVAKDSEPTVNLSTIELKINNVDTVQIINNKNTAAVNDSAADLAPIEPTVDNFTPAVTKSAVNSVKTPATQSKYAGEIRLRSNDIKQLPLINGELKINDSTGSNSVENDRETIAENLTPPVNNDAVDSLQNLPVKSKYAGEIRLRSANIKPGLSHFTEMPVGDLPLATQTKPVDSKSGTKVSSDIDTNKGLASDIQQLPLINKENSTGLKTTETNPLPVPVAQINLNVNDRPAATPNTAQNPPAQPGVINKITTPDVKILTPNPESLTDTPAISVILQYATGNKVQLSVNGVAVESSLVGRTETDAATNLITQTWYGVSLKDGENTITAQIVNNGVLGTPTSIKVYLSGSPTQLTVKTQESRVPADGRSLATIVGQLLDKNGNLSNQDTVITLETSSGELAGVDLAPDRPGFQVQAKKGQFTANLRTSLNAQTARIRASATGLEAFTQIEFVPSLRPSIATGVIDFRIGAKGTDYYRSFREFLPPDRNNQTQIDLRTSVFATGKVGDWLFTGAYNSDRTLNQNCNCTNRLFRDVQSNEQIYPAYGDQSQVNATTPSQDSLYLRLERSSSIRGADPDFFMWGDYSTSEFSTRSQQFTSITRQLHGFKGNYTFGNLQATIFYGDNVQGFQRDTIVPDGTSGYYFVSRRLMVPGSENIFIELEEFDRPGTVLNVQKLSRGTDYEIDYDRGSILFRQPWLRTTVSENGTVLVRRIVASYQYESKDAKANIYGGRARYFLSRELNRESWIGATYLRENQGNRNFEIYGADALISFGKDATLIAEYAHSQNTLEQFSGVSGNAYRLEVEGSITDTIKGRAYLRSTDSGFSNNATTSFVPGQTRYGAQVQAAVSPTTNIRVQYDREDNKGIAPRPLTSFEDLFNPGLRAVPGTQVDNSLTTISAGIQQRLGNSNLELDYINRSREDRLATTPLSANSSQLRSRLTVPLTSKLTFRAQNELNLSSQQDLVYPNRTILGLDWAIYPGISIQLNHQFFNGGQYTQNSITSLDINATRKIGEDTTITGRYSLYNGQGSAGSMGIQQGITLAPGLKLSLAYEHIFSSSFNRTGAGQQFPQPYAVGQSASALGIAGGDTYSIGLDYTNNPNFKASIRYENRTSSSGTNTVLNASVLGKISPALTTIVRYNQANTSNQTLVGLGDTVNLKIGLAYRDPNNDSFNALLRYEYRKNPSVIPETILFGNGTGSEDHTFAVEAIYAPNWQWEFYGKYAMRNSVSYLAQDLVGSSNVSLAQLRATYRLGYSWDLVGEVRWINQPQAGFSEMGLVLETGYYLTPNLRASVGYSFGNVNDRDLNGSRSAGGFYAGLTFKINELFDGFGLQKVAPAQQKESTVSPITTNPVNPTIR